MKTTHLLIALNVVLYAIMLRVAGTGELSGFSTHTLLEFGANYAPLVREGQWWRLATAMFIHVTPLHILMNMVALYQVGTVLEPHYGRLRFVLLYLVAGLGGSAASLAWNWVHPVASAGASGAICGLIGAGAMAGHLMSGLTSGARQYRDAMLRWGAIVLVYGLAAHIDNAAHAGGIVVGAGVGYLFDRGAGALKRQKQKDPGIGLEALLLLAVVGGGFALAGRSRESSMLVEEVVNHGVELARAGKWDEAIVEYRRAIAMDPKDDVAHFDLALSLYRAKDYPGALAEAQKAIALNPARKGSWGVLADALDKLGRADESAAAEARYRALPDDKPGD